MGMFDSLYDSEGNEWQTKAYYCELDRFREGDILPGPPFSYQLEILGGPGDKASRGAVATVFEGILFKVPDERNSKVPLMDYGGGWVRPEASND